MARGAVSSLGGPLGELGDGYDHAIDGGGRSVASMSAMQVV